MSDPASAALFGQLMGGGIAAGGSIMTAGMNIRFQEKVNQRNEALMREAWAREDSAVQRRAADMEAAGFNPVLATGAAASTMPAVRADAPQVRENVGLSALQGADAVRDLAIKDKQAQLLQAQKEGVDLDNQRKAGELSPMIEIAAERAAQAVRETEIKNIEATGKELANQLAANEIRIKQQGVKVAEEWSFLNARLDNAIKQANLDEAKALALKAVASSKLLGQEAGDYEKIGLSESVVDRLFKIFAMILDLWRK